MNETCPNCNAVLAADTECLVCLMQIGLEVDAPTRGLEPAQLQAHFPDLELQAFIGRGGMGLVYRARQRDLDRTVAVKLLAPEHAVNPVLAERFYREAQALARLTHPHIVGVHAVGRAMGTIYFVMEYVEGVNLRVRLRTGRLSLLEALRFVPQICDAIQHAHDRGVIHRDIKPENVLITAEGIVKIADFGLSKLDNGDELALTDVGTRMGTAQYMAPEQWANTAAVDHRADIYSLGVMLYEMLTGELPSPRCKSPSQKVGIDPRLDQVVERSLRAEPAERYQQAAQMKSDLEHIASRPLRRLAPVLAILFGIVVVVGLICLGAMFPRVPPEPVPSNGAAQRERLPLPRREWTPTEVLTAPEWEWTTPENLGNGINTAFGEQFPFVTDDGLTLLFSSNRPGGFGGYDLWQCQRASVAVPFANPVNLGPAINSKKEDTAPCLASDGLTLVFISRRTGPDSDIWIARRASVDAAWEPAQSLGPPINSKGDEYRPWMSRDGLRLTFDSHRAPAGQTGAVWQSRRPTPLEPFGRPRPFAHDAFQHSLGGLSFSSDEQTLLCNRFDRLFTGDLLWLSRIDGPDDPFRRLTSFGPIVNTCAIDTSPMASVDGRIVYFQSDRPGGVGNVDLWLMRRVHK